jgi:hypothetical protein
MVNSRLKGSRHGLASQLAGELFRDASVGLYLEIRTLGVSYAPSA